MFIEESAANSPVRTRAGSDGNGFFLLVILALMGLLLQGCVALQVRHPLPHDLLEQAQMAGLPGIRAWGDVYSEILQQSAIESIKQMRVLLVGGKCVC